MGNSLFFSAVAGAVGYSSVPQQSRMYRAEASANKTLTKKWRRRNHARHRARLSSVRSRIDNSPPRPYAHLHVNLKKLQTEEERMSQIERDNRILLNKMSRIMRQRHTLDNSNSRYSARAGKPSLNRLKRKKELARITRENQRILARIQSVQPTYNHVAWEADRDRQKALLSNICEYPHLPPAPRERPLRRTPLLSRRLPPRRTRRRPLLLGQRRPKVRVALTLLLPILILATPQRRLRRVLATLLGIVVLPRLQRWTTRQRTRRHLPPPARRRRARRRPRPSSRPSGPPGRLYPSCPCPGGDHRGLRRGQRGL